MSTHRRYLSQLSENGTQASCPADIIARVLADARSENERRARDKELLKEARKLDRAEKRARAEFQARGYRFTKRGWPDFLLVNPSTGGVAVVEVKHGKDEPVSPEQRFVLGMLASFGIPAYVWTPGHGLRQVQPRKGLSPGPLKPDCPPWTNDHKKSPKDRGL